MYDNLTITLDVPPSHPLADNIYAHLDLPGMIPVLNERGEIVKDRCFVGNLLVEYHATRSQLKVTNSWHKFYHHNNYCPYTLCQVEETAALLSEALKIDLASASVKKVEYGCNLPLDQEARSYYQSLISYKDKAFQPMIWKREVYGAACHLSHSHIKWYDKTKQVRIADGVVLERPLLRYEIRVSHMQYLHRRAQPIRLSTVQDLWNKDYAQLLAADLLRTYDRSLKEVMVELKALTLREKTAFARMSHAAVKHALKLHHRRSYENDLLLYKRALDKAKGGEQELRRAIELQCTYLLEH
jgi:hypothetical protein